MVEQAIRISVLSSQITYSTQAAAWESARKLVENKVLFSMEFIGLTLAEQLREQLRQERRDAEDVRKALSQCEAQLALRDGRALWDGQAKRKSKKKVEAK